MAEDTGRRKRSGRGRSPADEERGLRGVIGAGPSQVSLAAAMRARDAARPTPADEAAAEQAVRVVRRNYVPPASGGSGSTRDRS